MNLTAKGREINAVGGGTISVDGVVIQMDGPNDTRVDARDSGPMVPYDGERCIGRFERHNDGAYDELVDYDCDTQRFVSLAKKRPVSRVVGGGTTWAAFSAMAPDARLWTSAGWEAIDTLPLCVSDDGVLYTTGYQRDTSTVRWRTPNGQQLDAFDTRDAIMGDATAGAMLRALPGGRFAWIDSQLKNRAVGFTLLQRDEPLFWIKPVLFDGTIFVLERSDDRLTVRPANELGGWVIGPGCYSPDMRVVNDQLKAAWSTGQGERPHERDRFIVDINAPRVRIERQMPKAPNLDRRFLFGGYTSRSNTAAALAIEPTGISLSATGNTELPIEPSAEQLASVTRRIVIPGPYAKAVPKGKILAHYLHLGGNSSPAEIAAAITAARPAADADGVGLVIYFDHNIGYPRAAVEPLLQPGDFVCPQWYLEPGESDAHLYNRIVDELDALKGLPVIGTVCAYRRTGRLTRGDLARAWNVYFHVAESRPDLLGYLYFAELRADGVRGETAYLQPMFEDFANGLTGLPESTVAPAPAPPPTKPTEPPPPPKPTPVPVPPPSPDPIPAPPDATHFPKARSLMNPIRAFVKINGLYIGIATTPVDTVDVRDSRGRVKRVPVTGDDRWPVYANRTEGHGWEQIEFTPHEDGQAQWFDARFVDSNRQASRDNEGQWVSRTAGTFGPFEKFGVAEQPDGRIFGWRKDGIGGVFEVFLQ